MADSNFWHRRIKETLPRSFSGKVKRAGFSSIAKKRLDSSFWLPGRSRFIKRFFWTIRKGIKFDYSR